MPSIDTYIPIQTITLSSNQASISFPSIPQTYHDLIIRANLRSNRTDYPTDGAFVRFNGDTTAGNYTGGRLYTYGTTKGIDTNKYGLYAACSPATASIYSNSELKINNYTSNRQKSCFSSTASPNHGGNNGHFLIETMVWSGTAPVSSITITPHTGTAFLAGSTVTLYGVGGKTSLAGTKATGGTVMFAPDGYVYHYITTTGAGTFSVNSNISADILLLGGGGAGGGISTNGTGNGGGGAGGFAAYASQNLSSGTYNYSVGVGGTAGNSTGGNGGSTTFTGLTSAVGGGGGGTRGALGNSGGSGGGNGSETTSTPAQGTSGQGFAGGTGASAPNYGGGGGGGAGGAGVNGSGTIGGNGGIPKIWLDGFYYGSGGGGGVYNGGTAGKSGRTAAGTGSYGGSGGAPVTSGGSAGVAAWNGYGSGGGGSSNGPSGGSNGGAGGSGLIVVRYIP